MRVFICYSSCFTSRNEIFGWIEFMWVLFLFIIVLIVFMEVLIIEIYVCLCWIIVFNYRLMMIYLIICLENNKSFLGSVKKYYLSFLLYLLKKLNDNHCLIQYNYFVGIIYVDLLIVYMMNFHYFM